MLPEAIEHFTIGEVRSKSQAAIGEYDELLTLVKKRKKRKRCGQKTKWEDNIKEWTGMDFVSSRRAAENRTKWIGIVANTSEVPRRPFNVMP